jgi:hypothetical protein
MFHLMAEIGLETNGTEGEVMLGNTRWKAGGMWHLGYKPEHGYELSFQRVDTSAKCSGFFLTLDSIII